MRIYVPLLAALLCSTAASAQFETNYTPVQNRGQLPNDFVTLSSEKYSAEKATPHQHGNSKSHVPIGRSRRIKRA